MDPPWIVIGDFNVVRNMSEAVGGNPHENQAMDDFSNCIQIIDVMKMYHSGCEFTWSRNWDSQSILRVLDRVLCSKEWLHKMQGCRVHYQVPVESDHCAMDVSLYTIIALEPRPFKYYHFLECS
ncbi:hypothetical protein LIER_36640 [Lithospermum erythrorhizon]|uniref:Endonuclease/exonuclease/phosphatase domain-containing protein n=1 Tax=Lithospermum erythrorhizon TaxID=34254 RepID=A0AAV3P9X0_LITER